MTMMDRQRQMGRLFANFAEHGIGETQRHGWASGVLNREVKSFTSLTAGEIEELIGSLIQPPDDEYVMCGAPCPDGWPCVVDAGHIDRGEDHAREDGLAWMVR
jgi:hypothetical protein